MVRRTRLALVPLIPSSRSYSCRAPAPGCAAPDRRQREVGAPPQDIASPISQFRYDLDTQYQVIELDQALIELASELALRHPLRTYDAVQLAAGWRVQSGLIQARGPALTFLSADVRLLTVAQTEGLLTDNPNLHR